MASRRSTRDRIAVQCRRLNPRIEEEALSWIEAVSEFDEPGKPRAGWAEASKAVAEDSDDALEWPEFPNAEDSELEW
jgi:hypothetical protein